jgi:hypothetical protein
MKKNSTIKYGIEWALFEEMVGKAIFVKLDRPNFVATQEGVTLELPPNVIDAIRDAPASAFPHLRNNTQLSADEKKGAK